jgi:hypothetical protein
VGEGGHLTLRLASPVLSGPGAEIGVYTHVGLTDAGAWPNLLGQATDPAAAFGVDSALVEVSSDGTSWESLGEVTFDMPAMFYTDSGPYDFTPGSSSADFGLPFVPTAGLADFDGKTNGQIVTLLGGSAGGRWLDISGTGLAQVEYVRFSVADDGDENSILNFELDAVAINSAQAAPEPGMWLLLAAGGAATVARRRKRRT